MYRNKGKSRRWKISFCHLDRYTVYMNPGGSREYIRTFRIRRHRYNGYALGDSLHEPVGAEVLCRRWDRVTNAREKWRDWNGRTSKMEAARGTKRWKTAKIKIYRVQREIKKERRTRKKRRAEKEERQKWEQRTGAERSEWRRRSGRRQGQYERNRETDGSGKW